MKYDIDRFDIIVGIILAMVAVAGIVGYYQLSTAPQVNNQPSIAPQASTETITVEIRTVMQNGVERHVFDPATVTVHKGDHIILIVTNTDEHTHGLAIPQLNLDTGPLREDQQVKLGFDATTPGTYTIVCSVPGCAPDHSQMIAQLVVSE